MYIGLRCAGHSIKTKALNKVIKFIKTKHSGVDGILVTVGLCIIALVLCVLMKTQLAAFIGTIVEGMTNKATEILKMTG